MQKNYGLFGLDILRLKKDGYIWTFNHKDGKLIFKSHQEDTSEINQWQEVCDDFCGYFSFLINPQNELYLIYKNQYEQAICQKITFQGKGEIYKIGFSKGEQILFQKIINMGENRLIIFIFTENYVENCWKIYSCYQENGIWMEPKIVDSGWGISPGRGTTAIGNEGQVYLVYQIFYKGEYHLVYRIYKDSIWSDRTTIVTSPEFNFAPHLTIDKEGTPHLVWLRSIKSENYVMYTKRSKSNNFWARLLWQKEKIIFSSGPSPYAPFILWDKQLKIHWQVDQGFKTLIYCLKVGQREVEVIAEFENRNFSEVLLDLDKYPDLANYDGIDGGSTLFFLLTALEEAYAKPQYCDFKTDELINMTNKIQELEDINSELRNNLKKKMRNLKMPGANGEYGRKN